MPADSSTSTAPPNPASIPDITTPMYFIRYTPTPSDSAAAGCSPTERIRNPSEVRHSTNHVNGTRSNAIRVSQFMSVVIPWMGPAISEITGIFWRSSDPITLEITGTLNVPTFPTTWGDCVALPPVVGAAWPTTDRNRADPTAMMLMPTPDATCSMPNVTVATAWISPNSPPPM